MVKICFVDGTEEVVESDDNTYYYRVDEQMFEVVQNGHFIDFPREFVKSIRVIEV